MDTNSESSSVSSLSDIESSEVESKCRSQRSPSVMSGLEPDKTHLTSLEEYRSMEEYSDYEQALYDEPEQHTPHTVDDERLTEQRQVFMSYEDEGRPHKSPRK